MPGTSTTLDVPAAPPVRRRPFWPVVRGAVVLGWLLLLAAVVLTGERDSSVDSLVSAAAAGKVSEVRVTGSGFDPGMRGYSVEQVRWSEGPQHFVAEIVEATPRHAGLRARTGPEGRRVVTTDALAYLTTHVEDVRVTRTPEAYYTSSVGPWHVLDWVLWGLLTTWVATMFLLMVGPRPWRATRWAWAWLVVGAPPVGIPAFLVLSGPVPGLPAPRPGARVLTGGWAFLLTAFLLGPLLKGLGVS